MSIIIETSNIFSSYWFSITDTTGARWTAIVMLW